MVATVGQQAPHIAWRLVDLTLGNEYIGVRHIVGPVR